MSPSAVGTTDRLTDPAATTASARAAAGPDTAHRTFRAVLDALARPGTPHRLPTSDTPDVPAVLLPALALADLGVTVHVAGDPEWVARWSPALVAATDATATAPEHARLVVLGPGADPALLARAAVGSATAPEDGALVTVAVGSDDDTTGSPLVLTGPGVDGRRHVTDRGLPAGWRAAREQAPFPAGLDLLLVDGDGVVGLPRSTRVVSDTPEQEH